MASPQLTLCLEAADTPVQALPPPPTWPTIHITLILFFYLHPLEKELSCPLSSRQNKRNCPHFLLLHISCGPPVLVNTKPATSGLCAHVAPALNLDVLLQPLVVSPRLSSPRSLATPHSQTSLQEELGIPVVPKSLHLFLSLLRLGAWTRTSSPLYTK